MARGNNAIGHSSIQVEREELGSNKEEGSALRSKIMGTSLRRTKAHRVSTSVETEPWKMR